MPAKALTSCRSSRCASRDAYSRFVLKRLLPHVDTPHVLLVQWDGYVVNADAWDAAFARRRLHRREVVLARRRSRRRQRRLLAALAALARGAAGLAHRARRGRGYDDRSHVPDACSNASTASASPMPRSPIASHSRRRTRSAGRSDSTASTTSAGSCRPRSSPRSWPASATRSCARRSSPSCCATAWRWASGSQRSRSRGACST